MGRHDLPWMGAGQTPLPSGADGLLSRALGGLPDHADSVADQACSFFRTQAMFCPRVRMVCMPSSSFSTWPASRPIPMFQ